MYTTTLLREAERTKQSSCQRNQSTEFYKFCPTLEVLATLTSLENTEIRVSLVIWSTSSPQGANPTETNKEAGGAPIRSILHWLKRGFAAVTRNNCYFIPKNNENILIAHLAIISHRPVSPQGGISSPCQHLTQSSQSPEWH